MIEFVSKRLLRNNYFLMRNCGSISVVVVIFCLFPLIASAYILSYNLPYRDFFNFLKLIDSNFLSPGGVFFICGVYIIVAILQIPFLVFVFHFMVVNHANFLGKTLSVLMKIQMTMPIVFFTSSAFLLLDYLGFRAENTGEFILICIFLTMSLIPTSVGIISGQVEIHYNSSEEIRVSLRSRAYPRGAAFFASVTSRVHTVRSIVSVSLFSSFRVIAEVGVLRAIIFDGSNLGYKEFIVGFLSNLDPDQYFSIGLMIFTVGFLSMVLSFVFR